MNIVVEQVNYQDSKACDELVQLLDNYASDPMGGGQPLSDFTRTNLAAKLADIDGAVSLLARIDERPVGFANCFQGFSTFSCAPLLNIHDIAVEEAYRGRGIAAKLLDEIASVASERGCCKVTLEVLTGNVTAKSVYLRAGFRPSADGESHGPYEFWDCPL